VIDLYDECQSGYMKLIDVFSIIKDELRRVNAKKSKPIRVAINGIEGTGKTTFAEALVEYLIHQGFVAHHVSIDGFHFNKKMRYSRGRNSAKGYYEDSYDELSFVKHVLQRSQQEPAEYIEATHDLLTDAYLDLPPKRLDDSAILVTDGCYLFKPVFNDFWDYRIYLKTDFATASRRGALRDQEALGGYEIAKEMFGKRYHAASKRYISEVNPENFADIIFDITDFENLRVVRL